MDWRNDSCPVCRQDAQEALPRDAAFVEVICNECGRYRIANADFQAMRREDNGALRTGKLQAAKDAAQPGAIPFIKSAAF